MVPVLTGTSNPKMFHAYAVMKSDNDLVITLINKQHGPADAHNVEVSVSLDRACDQVEYLSLAAPNGDVAATTDITLGGASIGADGNWSGVWTPLAGQSGDKVTLKVPAATAILLNIRLH